MKKLTFLIPVVFGLAVTTMVWKDQALIEPETDEPHRILSNQPDYESLAAMLFSTDLVVVGEVKQVDVGRTYTDPNDPRAGVISQLATLNVISTVSGPETEIVLIEQEASLLDGTPVEIDGAPPMAIGDSVLVFLVENQDPNQPYFGVLGRQGIYEISDPGEEQELPGSQFDDTRQLRAIGSADNPDVESLHTLTLQEAIRRIRLNEEAGTVGP